MQSMQKLQVFHCLKGMNILDAARRGEKTEKKAVMTAFLAQMVEKLQQP